jgi:hypothetical protein
MENMGLRITHVDLPYDDLWAALPGGRIVRVQVKSSKRPQERSDLVCRTKRYDFKVNPHRRASYDGVYIFVALDQELMFARRWDDRPPFSIKVNPREFTRERQFETLRREFDL